MVKRVLVFNTFKAGHRIWVQITNQDLVYQLDHDTSYTSEMLPVPAENAIYHDSTHLSHLLLPVVPDAPMIKKVEPPVSEISWQPLTPPGVSGSMAPRLMWEK